MWHMRPTELIMNRLITWCCKANMTVSDVWFCLTKRPHSPDKETWSRKSTRCVFIHKRSPAWICWVSGAIAIMKCGLDVRAGKPTSTKQLFSFTQLCSFDFTSSLGLWIFSVLTLQIGNKRILLHILPSWELRHTVFMSLYQPITGCLYHKAAGYFWHLKKIKICCPL